MSGIFLKMCECSFRYLLAVPISNSDVSDHQTARCVGERERQTSAEDEGRPPVQAAHRHSRAAGPQHLQVRMWS